MAKGEIEIKVKANPCDRESVILFDLLEEIKMLKEWRFENCKHKSGFCRDKRSCDSCQYAKCKTGDLYDKT